MYTKGVTIECPKCKNNMSEHAVDTLSGHVVIDRCEHCNGLWFDHGELDILKNDWMSEFLDPGDPSVGKKFNNVTEIDYPRCSTRMISASDPNQTHIVYEVCKDHGVFMDAGEFTDYKYDTLLDIFRDVVYKIRS